MIEFALAAFVFSAALFIAVCALGAAAFIYKDVWRNDER
jgi:hypothetical protein